MVNDSKPRLWEEEACLQARATETDPLKNKTKQQNRIKKEEKAQETYTRKVIKHKVENNNIQAKDQ